MDRQFRSFCKIKNFTGVLTNLTSQTARAVAIPTSDACNLIKVNILRILKMQVTYIVKTSVLKPILYLALAFKAVFWLQIKMTGA